jgi:hypothetical protein
MRVPRIWASPRQAGQGSFLEFLHQNPVVSKIWISLIKLEKNPFKWDCLRRGVKGIHPLGCLPLWGSEEVTFILGLKVWLSVTLIYHAKFGSAVKSGQRILQ